VTPPARRAEEDIDRRFERAARWLLVRRVHPNHFTLLQIPLFILIAVSAAQGWALAFVLLNLFVPILDGGDGILARVGGLATKTGAVLDTLFDTVGIAIVLWGAAKFYPDATLWVMLLFIGTLALFLQNALLERKAIAYVRGPLLMAVLWPQLLPGGIGLPAIITAWLLLWRMPETLRALAGMAPPTLPQAPRP
jgi:phosphatidylglycerophosphate synthase